MLIKGDCLEELKTLEDNSIDSIVTDPPYGLSFMGKKWDYDVPSQEIWEEALRVLKPGGYLLSFAGTRTYHRMAVRIEDAGFEIRDMISWLYGSGFPKSHNIGKAVDKLQGNERKEVGRNPNSRENCNKSNTLYESGTVGKTDIISKGTSEWEGWGTALKPACELIVVARKPLSERTVASNVLKYGTGGINIDECRVEITDTKNGFRPNSANKQYAPTDSFAGGKITEQHPQGRFPANIILDEEAGKMLGEPSRFFYCAKASKSERNMGCEELEEKLANKNGQGLGRECSLEKREQENGDDLIRLKNNHPTVKPLKLMTYLIKLVTKKGGVVLDPFMGSGSTGIACKQQGYDFVGIERDEEYFKIAETRIEKTKVNNNLIK